MVVSISYCQLFIVIGWLDNYQNYSETTTSTLLIYLTVAGLAFLSFVIIDTIIPYWKKIVSKKDNNTNLVANPKKMLYGNQIQKIGVLFLGIGSFAHYYLMFLQENYDEQANQSKQVTAICKMIFILFEMIFIFWNQRLNIFTHRKPLVQFGLMHLIAVNAYLGIDAMFGDSYSVCQKPTKKNPICSLFNGTGPLPNPILQFCLICAAILFVMWKNVDQEQEHQVDITVGVGTTIGAMLCHQIRQSLAPIVVPNRHLRSFRLCYFII